MSNCRDHDHSNPHATKSAGLLKFALVLTAAFMVVEFVGGIMANSLALISDAAHMLTDTGALALSLIAAWISQRPKTSRMSYGYHRAEIIGALANGLVIWLLAGVIIYEGLHRLGDPSEVNGKGVVIIASIGLMVNFIAMKILHQGKGDSMNVRAAYLHVFSDLLGSVGAIAAGVVIWVTGWKMIDPIVSFVVAGLILFSSWRLIQDAIAVLMESTPKGIDPDQVMTDLRGLSSVQGVHDLHIWQVASGLASLSVHLISDKSDSALSQAHSLLREKHKITHTTIQVEHPERFDSCDTGC